MVKSKLPPRSGSLALRQLKSIKTKESITFEKLGSSDFWRVANSALMKGKSSTPQLFSSTGVLSSASSDKAKLFAKAFEELLS